MPELKFTPEQRLIVALLCDALREPKDREFRTDNLKLIMEAIYGGHDWAIGWELGGLFPERTDTKEQVSYVGDVMDMWSFIENGYDKLDAEGKQKVKDEVAYISDGPRFLGFDGNNEAWAMGIAMMFVNTMGRFSNFRGRDFNSHAPTEHRYSAMLEKWPEIRARLHARDMSADEIIHLLAYD